jgi:hypothetical protein
MAQLQGVSYWLNSTTTTTTTIIGTNFNQVLEK